ncbi:glutamate-5-semialdehyde dehydrogenase [bacterium]|nr:glutamate-5-semialdehyde dehydrogenase [bacterium]
MRTIRYQCELARRAQQQLLTRSASQKNALLRAMADCLIASAERILSENAMDVEEAMRDGQSVALVDRLTLTPARLEGMAAGLRDIAALTDPVGSIVEGWVQPNGLQIRQVRVPLGVVGIIYEARPNVTTDAIGLCIKTGNSVVLRGSSSTFRSNQAIVNAVLGAFSESTEADCIQLLDDTRRESVVEFVQMKGLVDLVIPRGGAQLIQTVITHATVPSIETGVGNCHIFVDESADLDWATSIILNAKVQRPSVCNSCETILIHEAIADRYLPRIVSELNGRNVEVRGCDRARSVVPTMMIASDSDWDTEYLDLIIAVKIVGSVADAVHHIRQHGTLHSEAIVSNDFENISWFTSQVDAAAVLVNASTRFVDGGEFGFGAEMGISTQKLHARGPMGLKELTTMKYIVVGSGHVR